MKKHIRSAAAVLAATLAGCGGGGGSDNVALKSEADVAREIQNISTLYVQAAPAPKAAGSASGRRLVGVHGLLSQSRAGQARAARTAPAAKVTGACSSGTYTYDDYFNQVRSLPLLGVSPSLDYTIGVDADCRYVEGTYSEFYDGYYEYGDNGSYTAGTAEAPYYEYYADGSGSTPYRLVFVDTAYDEELAIRTLGRYEGRDNGTSYESREIFRLDFSYALGGDSLSLYLRSGSANDPLIYSDNYDSDGTLSIDGPLHYSSDFCDGGNLVYDTVERIAVGYSDTYGYYASAGELHIQSGGAGVTLEFQSNGDVLYTFDDGGSGTVTLDEVASAEGCLFTP